MTFDVETVRKIQSAAKLVLEHTNYQATRANASDVPEFVAGEILDLVEWVSPSPETQANVAKLVLDNGNFPQGVRLPVCRHFNLPY